MDQGWKRLPLLVVFLLFWKNADGFKGGAYSNTRHWGGQPSDTFSPCAAQSSMCEKVLVTGTLPVEEVDSSLFSNKPLKSKSKFNPLQFVKGGSSSSQSTSHAQTAPGSSVSASLPLPLDEQPLSSLTSAGSTISGAASGSSFQTQYAASGSGHLVSTQGGSSSYPAKFGVSGQSISDSLHLSTSQETSVHQSAEASLPVFSYSSSSVPGAASTSQSSSLLLSESSGNPVSSPGEGSYSGLSQGASSLYTLDSNAKLSSTISSQSTGHQSSPSRFSSSSQGSSGMLLVSGSSLAGLRPLVGLSSNSRETSSQLLPLVLSSQSTSAQSSPSGSPNTQSRSGIQLATSNRYVSVQGGSSSTSFSHKPQGTLGQYAPLSPTKYVSAPMSSPQAIYSQATSSGSSNRAVSKVGSLSQAGASGSFASPGGNYYSVLLPQSPATSSQYAPGYSKPISSPQSTSSQSAGVLSPHKQYASASQGSSRAQFGASTGFASQGLSSSYSGSGQSQGAASQFAPGPSPYASVSLSSPQAVAGPSTVQGSRKQFTSTFTGGSGTQAGSSTPFTLHGSTAYGGSPQGAASQFAPGPSPYASVSLSSPQAVAGPSTVQGSRKQFTSTFTGGSGTQAGSSTPFTLHGSTAYGGSPQTQNTAGTFAPGYQTSCAGVSLSSPQAGPSTVQGTQKQFTSTFTGGSGTQAGSSTPFTLHGSTAYGGSPQGAASQFAPGPSPYASVSLSSPQAVAGPSTVQGSRKQFTSTFTGGSGTRAGSSTPFTLQGSNAYGGSSQPQGAASQFASGPSPYASVSLSSPQAGPSTVQGTRKQFTSTFTGGSGTQAGSSTPFTLHGSTAYGGSPQTQNTAGTFAPGYQTSYASVSLSSPQAVAGPSTVQGSRKQFTSTFTGGSGTRAGSSTPFTLQGSNAYGGSSQPQGAASQFASGPSPYASVSLSSPQAVAGPSTVQGSRKQFTSTFTGGSGTQAGSSTPFTLHGSTAYGGSPQGAASQFAPGPSPYASVSLSSPQAVAGPSTVQGSRKQFTSTFTGGSGTQAGSSTPFTLHGSTAYGGSPQTQNTAGTFAPGYQTSYASVSLSSPQAGPSTVQGTRKQFTSTFTGGSGTQAGSSTPFTLHGSTAYGGSPQGAASQFAPGPSPYASVSLSSPQAVAGPSTVQGSRKQFTSTFTGGSTPFTLHGSTAYGGSPQGAASQFAPGPSPYASVSLSSPQAGAGPSTVQGSRKQFTSAYVGSFGTEAGSFTPFTQQGSTAYGGSPQGAASQFAPGPSPYASVSLSSPQAGPSTVQGTRKQFTSTFTGGSGTQAGSSTPFTLHGSTAYGGSPQTQNTAGTFAPGYQTSYAGVSLSSPQAVAGPSTVQGSRKQFTSTFTGGSGTRAGSFTPFIQQGSTAYGGSPQGAASQFAPGPSPYASVSLSSPQAGPSTVQGTRKQFTSTFTGGSGTQAGSSTPFTLHGSTAYGGSPQTQNTAGTFAPGYQTSYAGVSLSSPQAVAGPSTVQGSRKQFTSTFTGGSGTRAGSSTPFTLQGSTAYGGSPQGAASQFAPGPSPYASVPLSSTQGAASQSSQPYQGYSVSQRWESQKWQPSATRWTPVIRTSDATVSQGSSSSQNSPMQFSSLSSAGGSSRVSGQLVSAHGGSARYGGPFQSQSLSTKYTPGFQHLPYDTSVAGQGTSSASASEVLSSYSSMNNQNAPAQPSRRSSSSRFYAVKG